MTLSAVCAWRLTACVTKGCLTLSAVVTASAPPASVPWSSLPQISLSSAPCVAAATSHNSYPLIRNYYKEPRKHSSQKHFWTHLTPTVCHPVACQSCRAIHNSTYLSCFITIPVHLAYQLIINTKGYSRLFMYYTLIFCTTVITNGHNTQ